MSNPIEPSEGEAGGRNGAVVIGEWSGPLPPPAVLESYDRIVEGGAERVFRQFEEEARHRRLSEQRSLDEFIRENKTAQWLAGAFAFGCLGVGAFALSLGHAAVAGVILGTTLVGVVVAFLMRKREE